MAIHYSQYFNLLHRDFVNKGVYNGFLDKDSLLHIDPLLLRDCTISEFTDSYNKFLNYFRSFIPLVKHTNQPNEQDRFYKKIIQMFTMREIPNTGLGFSKEKSHGTGISGTLSRQLARSTYDIIQAGLEDPEIFALMQLIEERIGADRISDMTLCILQEDFLAYTQRIAKELGIHTQKYNFNYHKEYDVPFYNGEPIHFIPTQLLTELPKALDYEDIDRVCSYNNQLKKKVANVIGLTWSEYKEYKKNDWKELLLKNRECYESAIQCVREFKSLPYNFSTDIKSEYLDVVLSDYVENLLKKYPLTLQKTSNISPQKEIFELTKGICLQFKKLVEYNRLSELFYRNKRSPDETDWQLLLYTIADTYKQAAKLDVSITREDNPGVGEIDFHLTRGSKANTVIEIKRSNNDNLIHGYRTQLPAYMKAENAKDGIFLIIMEDDSLESIQKKITNVQNDMTEKGEYIPEVIYVNGKRQYSASNRKYASPEI